MDIINKLKSEKIAKEGVIFYEDDDSGIYSIIINDIVIRIYFNSVGEIKSIKNDIDNSITSNTIVDIIYDLYLIDKNYLNNIYGWVKNKINIKNDNNNNMGCKK